MTRRGVIGAAIAAVVAVMGAGWLLKRRPIHASTAEAPIHWRPIPWSEPPGDRDAFLWDWSRNGASILVRLVDAGGPYDQVAALDVQKWKLGPARRAVAAARVRSQELAVLVMDEGEIEVVDLPELRTKRVLHTEQIYTHPLIAVSSDGNRLAMLTGGGLRGTTEIWDLTQPDRLPGRRHASLTDAFGEAAFVETSHEVQEVGYVKVDALSNRPLLSWRSAEPDAPAAPVELPDAVRTLERTALSGDGRTLFVVGTRDDPASHEPHRAERSLAVIELPSLRVRRVQSLRGLGPSALVDTLESSADGSRLVFHLLPNDTLAWKNLFVAWDTRTGRVLGSFAPTKEESLYFSQVHISPDGTRLLWARRKLADWQIASLEK